MNFTRTFFVFFAFAFYAGLSASEMPKKTNAMLIPHIDIDQPSEAYSYESRNSLLHTNSHSTEISPKSSSKTSPTRRDSLESDVSAMTTAMMRFFADAAQATPTFKENKSELLMKVASKLQEIAIKVQVDERVKEELERVEKEKIRMESEKLIAGFKKASFEAKAEIEVGIRLIALKDMHYEFPVIYAKLCILEELHAAEVEAFRQSPEYCS